MAKLNFSIITPVFCVTWSFRNHSNMLKQFLFLWKPWYILMNFMKCNYLYNICVISFIFFIDRLDGSSRCLSMSDSSKHVLMKACAFNIRFNGAVGGLAVNYLVILHDVMLVNMTAMSHDWSAFVNVRLAVGCEGQLVFMHEEFGGGGAAVSLCNDGSSS